MKTKLEANETAIRAIEILRDARPGIGTSESRAKKRAEAAAVLATLTPKESAKIDDGILAILTEVA